MIEEEERKRREEEEKKKQAEEARQAAIQKELEAKGQKSSRMILQAEAERTRIEVRQKIKTRLNELMKMEEENANKRPEDEPEGELDE